MTSTITPYDIATLIQGIASINVEYLAIAITIIFFASGLSYIFNIRPLQNSIRRHEKRLEILNKEVDKKIEYITNSFKGLVINQSKELGLSIDKTEKEIKKIKREAVEKIEISEKKLLEFKNEADRELKKLKEKSENIELDTLWNEHYMWSTRTRHGNAFQTLIEFLQKQQETNQQKYMIEVCLDSMLVVLTDISSNKTERGKKLYADLLKTLEKINEHDALINKVKDRAKEVFGG